MYFSIPGVVCQVLTAVEIEGTLGQSVDYWHFEKSDRFLNSIYDAEESYLFEVIEGKVNSLPQQNVIDNYLFEVIEAKVNSLPQQNVIDNYLFEVVEAKVNSLPPGGVIDYSIYENIYNGNGLPLANDYWLYEAADRQLDPDYVIEGILKEGDDYLLLENIDKKLIDISVITQDNYLFESTSNGFNIISKEAKDYYLFEQGLDKLSNLKSANGDYYLFEAVEQRVNSLSFDANDFYIFDS